MHALLIGATGATGTDLLQLLLNDQEFQRVDIFVRRSVDVQHPKLKVHVIDFDRPEQWKDHVKGDVLFSCLGTTLKAAGSKKAQWKIDYEYQLDFAKAASENRVHHYVLVSSAFASPKSSFFYSRMKGQLEVAVKALQFPALTIFNPPVLARKFSDRPGEIAGSKIIRFFNKLGMLRSQRPLPTGILAQAMINAAKKDTSGIFQYQPRQIWHSAGRESG